MSREPSEACPAYSRQRAMPGLSAQRAGSHADDALGGDAARFPRDVLERERQQRIAGEDRDLLAVHLRAPARSRSAHARAACRPLHPSSTPPRVKLPRYWQVVMPHIRLGRCAQPPAHRAGPGRAKPRTCCARNTPHSLHLLLLALLTTWTASSARGAPALQKRARSVNKTRTPCACRTRCSARRRGAPCGWWACRAGSRRCPWTAGRRG